MATIYLSACDEERLINAFVFFIVFLPAKQNADLAFVGISVPLNDQYLSARNHGEIMKAAIVPVAFHAKAKEHTRGLFTQ